MTDKKTILKKISEALNAGEREDAVAAVQKGIGPRTGSRSKFSKLSEKEWMK